MDPPEMHKLKTHSEQEVAYKPIIYKKKMYLPRLQNDLASVATPRWVKLFQEAKFIIRKKAAW